MEQSVEVLMEQKKISVRAFNVCINAGINNLAEIIDYYKRNKTFKNIRSCGELTEIELKALVKSCSLLNFELLDVVDTISFESLKIPNKLKLFCKSLGIFDEGSLVENFLFNTTLIILYEDPLTVKILKRDLVNIAQEIIEGDISQNYKLNFFKFIQKQDEKLLCEILSFNFQNLKARNKNVLIKLNLTPDDNPLNLIWIAFSSNSEVLNWRNIGSKSKEELSVFFEKCRADFNSFIAISKNPSKLLLRSLQNNYNLYLSDDQLYNIENGNLNFVEFIWLNRFNIFSEKEDLFLIGASIDSIAAKFNLTYERTRQISIEIRPKIENKLAELWNKLKTVSQNELISFSNLGSIIELDRLKLLYYQDQPFEFICSILKIIHKDKIEIKNCFELLESRKLSAQEKYALKRVFFHQSKFVFTNIREYLEIKSELNSIINQLLESKKDFLYFETKNYLFLSDCLKNGFSSYYGVLVYSVNFLFVFKHTNMSYCYWALSVLKKPSSIEDIVDLIYYNPEFHKDCKKTSIRSIITNKNNSEYFFSIGKSGKYGLISWNENNQYSTKSIKEECIDLLMKSSNPLHVNQIYNILKLKRNDLNYRSVATILNMETTIFSSCNAFCFLTEKKQDFENPTNHKTAAALIKKVLLNFYPLKDNFENPLLHKYLAKLPMPYYQLEYMKTIYLGEAVLKLNLSIEEEKIRELYFSGDQFLALQSFKKYYKTLDTFATDTKVLEIFNRIVE